MEDLQVIFHEDYLIIFRMKGNMKHKRRLFGIDSPPNRLGQIIQEQAEVWTAIAEQADPRPWASKWTAMGEQQVRPHWMGGAFVLVTKEHAEDVKRAVDLLSLQDRQKLFSTTSVTISPQLKGDLENAVNDYIQAWRDEVEGLDLKDLLKCFPRDTKIRISLPFN